MAANAAKPREAHLENLCASSVADEISSLMSGLQPKPKQYDLAGSCARRIVDRVPLPRP